MAVHQSLMTMRMTVRFIQRLARVMRVLMVFIVNVSVVMLDWFVHVLMLVPLSQVQPDTDSHQSSGNQELHRQTISQDQY